MVGLYSDMETEVVAVRPSFLSLSQDPDAG